MSVHGSTPTPDPVEVIDAATDEVLLRPMTFAIDTVQSLDTAVQLLLALRRTFAPVDTLAVRREWFRSYFERNTGPTAAFDLLHQAFALDPEHRFRSHDDTVWLQILDFYAEWVARERAAAGGGAPT